MITNAEDRRYSTIDGIVETPRPYRWNVKAFHKLGEIGIFHEDDRVELIEGEIIAMAPIGSGHSSRVKRLNYHLNALLNKKAIISVQDPVILGDYSEPEPDIALLRWRDDFYEEATPKVEDVLLIIEVADTTSRYDREVKVPVYANYGVPEVWIVDLSKYCLESYRRLVEGEYKEIKHYREGSIAPNLLPEALIDVAELFPMKTKVED